MEAISLFDELGEALERAEIELYYMKSTSETTPAELEQALNRIEEIHRQIKKQETCPHKRIVSFGGYYWSYGELTDNIHFICLDCGQEIDQ